MLSACEYRQHSKLHRDAAPLPRKPSNGSPFFPSYISFSCKYPHPVVDTNLFHTRSVSLSGIDGNMMLPICSCISAHTQPAAFRHSQQLPGAGFALPSSLQRSGGVGSTTSLSSRCWRSPAVLWPFTPTVSSSSVLLAPDTFQAIAWNCSL